MSDHTCAKCAAIDAARAARQQYPAPCPDCTGHHRRDATEPSPDGVDRCVAHALAASYRAMREAVEASC